jgi:hypothetical protein
MDKKKDYSLKNNNMKCTLVVGSRGNEKVIFMLYIQLYVYDKFDAAMNFFFSLAVQIFIILYYIIYNTYCIYCFKQEFRCDKKQLADSSEVFQAMFFGPLQEKGDTIYIPDVKPELFQIVMQ